MNQLPEIKLFGAFYCLFTEVFCPGQDQTQHRSRKLPIVPLIFPHNIVKVVEDFPLIQGHTI